MKSQQWGALPTLFMWQNDLTHTGQVTCSRPQLVGSRTNGKNQVSFHCTTQPPQHSAVSPATVSVQSKKEKT